MQIGGFHIALWQRFRAIPVWAQLGLWVVLWWALFFLWASTLTGRRRIAAVVVGLIGLVGIGLTGGDEPADERTVVAGRAQERETDDAGTTTVPVPTSSTLVSTTTSSTQPPATVPTTSPPTTRAVVTTTTRPPAPVPVVVDSTTTTSPTTPATTTDYVTPGAFCSPAGATGLSKNGVPMTCSTASCTGEPYGQPRWRRTTC